MAERTTITLYNGSTLLTHCPEQCLGSAFCCIHNPSDHPLKDAPYDWLFFEDEQIGVIYRMCEHGIAHPDPDSTEFLLRLWRVPLVEAIYSTHMSFCGCGCCQRPLE